MGPQRRRLAAALPRRLDLGGLGRGLAGRLGLLGLTFLLRRGLTLRRLVGQRLLGLRRLFAARLAALAEPLLGRQFAPVGTALAGGLRLRRNLAVDIRLRALRRLRRPRQALVALRWSLILRPCGLPGLSIRPCFLARGRRVKPAARTVDLLGGLLIRPGFLFRFLGAVLRALLGSFGLRTAEAGIGRPIGD